MIQSTGTIADVLKHKGHQVWSVSPDVTVFEAIQKLAEKNVGALLVMDGDRLVGIFSERDYTRKVALRGRSSKETKVREILSERVICATPQHSVEDGLRLMTEHRIRHLPVVENHKVGGIVSIGDLVNWVINQQSQTIKQLESYITGGYPS